MGHWLNFSVSKPQELLHTEFVVIPAFRFFTVDCCEFVRHFKVSIYFEPHSSSVCFKLRDYIVSNQKITYNKLLVGKDHQGDGCSLFEEICLMTLRKTVIIHGAPTEFWTQRLPNASQKLSLGELLCLFGLYSALHGMTCVCVFFHVPLPPLITFWYPEFDLQNKECNVFSVYTCRIFIKHLNITSYVWGLGG
jgi:hypothetical protein